MHNGLDKRLSARLAPIFEMASLPVVWRDHIEVILWGKLLININNAVNALSGLPFRKQLMDRGYRKIYAQALDESIKVLKSHGIGYAHDGPPMALVSLVLRLPNWLFSRLAAKMLKLDENARSSMWFDLDQHKPTEIDALNGEICRLARQRSIAVPVNDMLVALVKRSEKQDPLYYSAEEMDKSIQRI